MSRMVSMFRVVIGSLLVLGCVAAQAQDWPPKQVRIIVPYSAGGSTDAIARNLGRRMQSELNTAVVAENITGGGTLIAAQAVLRAPADGATLFFTGSGIFTLMKFTNTLPFEPMEVLQPITLVNRMPHWLIVRTDRPQNTLQDLVSAIRKNPGTVNISVNEVGGVAHLALLNWAKNNKLDFAIVPYRGSPPAMIDLLGGATTAHLDVVGSSVSFVKAGKAKPLAMLQETPVADFPQVPTSPAESSGGLVMSGQHTLAVRQGTPVEVTNRIYELTKKIVNEPEFVAFLRNFGFEQATPTPEETRQFLAQTSKKYGEIVRQNNLKLN